MSTAFIPLNRNYFKNEYYHAQKFTKWQAYLDLIYLAEFKEESNPQFVKGKELKINRGQIAISELTLAERWKWDVKTVRKFLRLKKSKGELNFKAFPEKNPGLTIITLFEYDQICLPFNKNQNKQSLILREMNEAN